MILCIGEILADMIGNVKDGALYYERKAGDRKSTRLNSSHRN